MFRACFPDARINEFFLKGFPEALFITDKEIILSRVSNTSGIKPSVGLLSVVLALESSQFLLKIIVFKKR